MSKKIYNRKNDIVKNKEFLLWYKKVVEGGYSPLLDIDEIDNLINKIVNLYEKKYSDKILNRNVINNNNTWENFKTGLNENEYRIIDCKYRNTKNKKNNQYVSLLIKSKDKKISKKIFYIMCYPDGLITNYDIDKWKNVLNITKRKISILDLYDNFSNSNLELTDYSEIKKCIDRYNIDLQIREKIYNSVIEKLIYSDKPLEKNRLIRARFFIRDIRDEYQNIHIDSRQEKVINIEKNQNEKQISQLKLKLRPL